MSDKSVIILVVSREILEGAVVDRNAAFLASRIDDLGYRVRSILVVDREETEMVTAIRWALEQKPTFLMITGGMGPSFDDNSRACVGKATGLPLAQDPAALDYVRNSYRSLHARGLVDDPELNDERARMANVPKGSECFENPVGTAPAVRLQVGPTTLFLLPGVPPEMQRLFKLFVLPAIAAARPGTIRRQRHFDYHGRDESVISSALREVAEHHPQVAFRTRMQGAEESSTIRITLVAEHQDDGVLDDLLASAERELRTRLGIELHAMPTDASRLGD